MNPRIIASSVLCAAFLLCLGTQVATADVVYFKNKRFLEGVIIKETKTHVHLDMGVGISKIPKSSLSDIERTDNEYLEKKWKRANFANAKYVPEGFEELAKNFRQLSVMRNDASMASRNSSGYSRMNGVLQEKITVLNQEIEESAERLKATTTAQKVLYNQLVATNNSLQSQLAQLTAKVSENSSGIGQVDSIVSAYTATLAGFRRSFDEQARDHQSRRNPDIKDFLDQMRSELDKYSKDYSNTPVATKKKTVTTTLRRE